MAERDPLEDFASGIGAGAYSPQQGSGLPVSSQGGLPFGSAPVPAPPPAGPAPSFGRIPAVVPQDIIQQMTQGNLLRQQQFSQVPRPGIDQRREQAVLTQQLDQLKGLANVRNQDRQLQAQYLKQGSEMVQNWHGLTAAEKTRMRPLFAPLLKNTLSLGQANLPDHVFEQALDSPDLARSFHSLLNEPLLAQRKDADLARLMESKDPDKTGKEIEAEHEKEFTGLVQQYLGPAVAKFGGSPDNPLDSQVFAKMVLEDPELGKVLKENPKLQRVFNATVNDPKNTDMLANIGLKTGKTAQLKQEEAVKRAMTLPNLKLIPETTVKYLLGVSGQSPENLNAMASKDPARFQAYIKAATNEENAVLERLAYQTGGSTALAKLNTPEKMSTSERKIISDAEITLAKIKAIEDDYDPAYVGVFAGRAGHYRENWTGAIDEKEARFRSANTSLSNRIIFELAQSQVPPNEEARIKKELPDMNTPAVTYESRLKMTKENNILLQYIKRGTMQKTGVKVDDLDPLPPLPARFQNHPLLFKKSEPGKLDPLKRVGEPTHTGRP